MSSTYFVDSVGVHVINTTGMNHLRILSRYMIPLMFSIILYFTVLHVLPKLVFHNQFSRIFCPQSNTLTLKAVEERGVKGKPLLWVAACSYCVEKKNIQRYQYFWNTSQFSSHESKTVAGAVLQFSTGFFINKNLYKSTPLKIVVKIYMWWLWQCFSIPLKHIEV